MAACAAICEAVRLDMVETLDDEAVGREGSKKPCECWRGRWPRCEGGLSRGSFTDTLESEGATVAVEW